MTGLFWSYHPLLISQFNPDWLLYHNRPVKSRQTSATESQVGPGSGVVGLGLWITLWFILPIFHDSLICFGNEGCVQRSQRSATSVDRMRLLGRKALECPYTHPRKAPTPEGSHLIGRKCSQSAPSAIQMVRGADCLEGPAASSLRPLQGLSK